MSPPPGERPASGYRGRGRDRGRGRQREEALWEPPPEDSSDSSDSDEPPRRARKRAPAGSGDGEEVDDLVDRLDNNLSALGSESASPRSPSPRRHSSSCLYPSLDSLHDFDSPPRSPVQHPQPHASASASASVSVPASASVCGCLWLVLLVLVAAAFAVYLALLRQHDRVAGPTVEEVVADLSSAFPAQTRELWAAVRSQLKRMLRAPPSRPAVLLLAGTRGSRSLSCLARHLGRHAARALGRTVCVRADEDQAESGDAAKLEMHGVVANSYARGDRCFRVRLGRLPAELLLLLHALCDGDHAPYKDAVFLQELEMPGPVPDGKTGEAAVDAHLRELWNPKLGADEAAALIARVANSVLVVREEKETEEFRRNCDVGKIR